MKVSVSLITYNHALFIAQAIEGVLMQQTSFDFELLIGEDDSRDGTRQIVMDYQGRYPGRIRVFLNDRKNVVSVNGTPTGQSNFANNIRHSRGEYIALLDGDDYWTSPLKLEKQVAFLENNRDCALCFHNVRILDEADPARQELHHTQPMRAKYGIEDLLRGNFMHTCSVLFRSGLFGDLPAWFFKCPMGDWPLHVLNAQHGRIGYLDEVMGVYRKHAKGAWSAQTQVQVLAGSIQTAGWIRTSLNAAQKEHLDAGVYRWYQDVIGLCCSAGDPKAAVRCAALYLRRFPFSKDADRLFTQLYYLRTRPDERVEATRAELVKAMGWLSYAACRLRQRLTTFKHSVRKRLGSSP
jgi:glycosyltransferase involved in cell wall biosynthesis